MVAQRIHLMTRAFINPALTALALGATGFRLWREGKVGAASTNT